MKFPILIKAGSQRFRLVCELVDRDKRYETFKVYPEQKPEKFILLQNNRPFIRGKGLKNKRLEWKVEGEVKYESNLDQAIKQLERYLEPPDSAYHITIEEPSQAATTNRKKKGPGGSTLGERATNS